jgi:predicted nucleic acid-binding protein
MSAVERVFVDSNIVLYALDADQQKHETAWKLQARYRFSYFDSLIIAAALAAGCSTLYSEDMQHGQVIAGRLTISNPFLADSVL